MATWFELVVTTTPERVDAVATALTSGVDVAKNGAEVRDHEVVLWIEDGSCDSALAAVREFVSSPDCGRFELADSDVAVRAAMPEAEWRDAYKRFFRADRRTRQIVVVPSWERYQPSGDDVVLHLDPGHAFGTGSHPTTQLVMQKLQALADSGALPTRICDLGCGSAILSIAAAKLWPSCTVDAIEVDDVALTAARENCERNAVADRISCTLGSSPSADERYDLVLANIRQNVLIGLVEPISAAIAPGGLAVLSGILGGELGDIATAYSERGLAESERAEFRDDEPAQPGGDRWWRMTWSRPA